MLQAMYWPVLDNPGMPLAWWQVSWMAGVGHVVAEPLWDLSLVTGAVAHGVYGEFLWWPFATAPDEHVVSRQGLTGQSVR
jgi:hypothetical protein